MIQIDDIGRVSNAFARACRAAPAQYVERWYAFADEPVRLRVAGRELAAHYHQPFAHLAIPPLPPRTARLTIDLWDEDATGVGCPPGVVVHTGRVTSADDGRLAYSPAVAVARYVGAGSITWLDRRAGRILGWRACGSALPFHERVRPLQLMLAIWYRDRETYVIHAGLVARRGQGILLVGPEGAGKSTSTVSCLCAGFAVLGDDYIGVRASPDGSFVGYSLFNTISLAPEQLRRFPPLAPYAGAGDAGDVKSFVSLSQVVPQRLPRSVVVRATALPNIVDTARGRVRAAAKSEALLQLAPNTMLQGVPLGGADQLAHMARLVARVPSYWLELGADLDAIPAGVDEILALVQA